MKEIKQNLKEYIEERKNNLNYFMGTEEGTIKYLVDLTIRITELYKKVNIDIIENDSKNDIVEVFPLDKEIIEEYNEILIVLLKYLDGIHNEKAIKIIADLFYLEPDDFKYFYNSEEEVINKLLVNKRICVDIPKLEKLAETILEKHVSIRNESIQYLSNLINIYNNLD